MEAGSSFEHYVLMELIAYRGLKELDFPISFWRTKTGLEVDFVLGDEIAIEVKISDVVQKSDLKGLIAYLEEYPKQRGVVVSQDKNPRKIILDKKIEITVLPWQIFLEQLWSGKLI